jgi:hypothetical protein
MDKERKREIIADYKQQKTTGGVYAIKNKETGKAYIKGDINMEAAENRFDFSRKVNSCIQIRMREDWEKYGPDSFTFEILKKIEQKNEESTKIFRDRLKKLEELCKEEYTTEKLY